MTDKTGTAKAVAARIAKANEMMRRSEAYDPMLAALVAAKLVLERRHPNPVSQSNAANDAKRWESEAAAAQTQVQVAIAAAKGGQKEEHRG